MAEKLRSHVSRVLQTSATPRCNLPSHLRKAVRDLKKDDTIMILPADKGNAMVVMDWSDYKGKLQAMLSNGTYQKLRKDPTPNIEREIGRTLRMTEEKGELTKEKRLFVTPRSSAPSQLYGLPKVHKEGTPMRPIVSAIGSPTHKLAKELARILSP